MSEDIESTEGDLGNALMILAGAEQQVSEFRVLVEAKMRVLSNDMGALKFRLNSALARERAKKRPT